LSFSRLALLVACLLALASSGCGYALAGRGSFLPAYIHTVAVPQIENRTAFTQVEQIVTEKIRNELIGRGKYQVTTERPGADAVLTGTITSIFVQPVALTSQQQASRYLFTLTMSVQFTDTRTNEAIWSNDALTFREEYDLAVAPTGTTTVEGATFLDQERSSFDRISNDLARTVVTAILEAF
jgi:outer membrane lipopolysaccharide assembly protein LptE/RlpB